MQRREQQRDARAPLQRRLRLLQRLDDVAYERINPPRRTPAAEPSAMARACLNMVRPHGLAPILAQIPCCERCPGPRRAATRARRGAEATNGKEELRGPQSHNAVSPGSPCENPWNRTGADAADARTVTAPERRLRALILAAVKRYRSRATAWWMLVALLVTQLATAAYACPLYERLVDGASHAASTGMPCPEARLADADPLCFEHCKGGGKLVDAPAAAEPPAAPPVVAGLESASLAASRPRHRPFEPFLARATAPPILASSARLRF